MCSSDLLTDIWACGILLHRMICGRHPLHPLDGNQLVVTAMLELPMPSMTEAAPTDVPRELIQIVDRCLLKIKEQRWQSAAQLLSALEVSMVQQGRILRFQPVSGFNQRRGRPLVKTGHLIAGRTDRRRQQSCERIVPCLCCIVLCRELL